MWLVSNTIGDIMNYQKINQNAVANSCEILDCDPSEIMYYAWPQTFSSTTGPFGGFGGQAISTFTIEAYSDGRDAILICNGKVWKRVQKFDPREAVVGKYR